MGVLSTRWEWTSPTLIKFDEGRQWELVPKAYYILLKHVIGIQALYFLGTGQALWQHLLYAIALGYIGGLGIAAGAHRLWAHRSYKAKLPLRILFIFMHTLVDQNSILSWSRDHRLHHKFCETNADPYNMRRGMFFSHIGWLLLKEHPEVAEKEKTIDLTDLQRDPVIAFQHKHFILFDLILNQMLPVIIPHYIWGTPLYICLCMNYFRFVFTWHLTAMGNSVAHFWTRKPYEKSMSSADVSWLSMILVGEGWHNFHHVFPWDYRSTDVGLYFHNSSTMFIDLMSKIGWAYDLKIVPEHVIRKRAERTGDGSHSPVGILNHNHESAGDEVNRNDSTMKKRKEQGVDKLDVGDIGPAPWGWGDCDIPEDDKQGTVTVHLRAG